jgi:membrane peptidoglycan carboxypeptidase
MATRKSNYDPWMRRTRRRSRKSNGRSGGRMSFWLKLGLALGLFGVIAFIGVAIAGIVVYNSYADDLVAPDELAINEASSGAKILDRNGKLLYEYVDDRAGLRRPVALENVAPAFLAATISTEDNSFFTNPGVNLKGLIRAAWENSPLGGSVFEGSGGSSITQQLVKNVYIPPEDRGERWSEDGINRKLKETIYAIELTDRYDKEQVLEWYVNQISYGGVYNGVEAAAQGYFGKPAKDLTLAEAAMLAGIPQSPAEYDPVNNPEAAKERRNEILDLMVRQSPIQIGEDTYYTPTRAEVAAAKAEDIHISEKRFPIRAPHFVLQYVQPLLEQLVGRDALFRAGITVTTSLDIDMQDELHDIMEEKITAPIYEGATETFEQVSNSHNAAMMYMDPKTGEILVMLGSRDYWDEEIEGKNNNATACNSPGSSFKPFAYITTFYYLGWGPGTIILDTPVEYKDPAGGKPFIPRDPIASTNAPMTIRNALGNSMNIPANKAAAAVGADRVEEMAKRFGFAQTFRPWWEYEDGCGTGGYGPAIATGGVGVTLEEMMIGYGVMANSGVMAGTEPITPHPADERQVDPVAILKIEDEEGNVLYDVDDHRREERVIEPEYTYLIWDILIDPNAECLVFSCGGTTIYKYPAGVKTGTSEPFDDTDRCAGLIGETWGFAYSPDVVVGIWAGNADNDCVEHLYSTSISYRAARDGFLAAMDRLDSVTPMERPAGVVQAEVCVPSGLLPSDLCGRTTSDLFAKEKLPEKEDDWWRRVTIDRRTGKVATSSTPSQYRKTQLALVPPEEWLQTDEDKKAAEEWAKELNIVLIEDGESLGGAEGGTDISGNVAILLPRDGQQLSAGLVQILGRATSPDFQGYLLEWGRGDDPDEWFTIVNNTNEVNVGNLGSWNATGLEDGTYTLRLTVLDSEMGNLQTKVKVIIGAPDAN